MTTISYSKIERDGKVNLALVLDGEAVTVAENHPAYNKILGYLNAGGEDEALVQNWYHAEKFVQDQLVQLTDKVTVEDGKLFFGEDEIDTALSRHILRLFRDGDAQFEALAKFMERLAKNPSPLSRYNLFTWLNACDFTITNDGLIVAYKNVQRGTHLSHASGPQKVLVNGVEYTGQVPNPYGASVRIDRKDVNPDRNQECSYGLHVGTYNYAKNTYNGLLLKVYVDPEDVVAVPRDCNGQKMRVCGYVVAKNENGGEDETEVTAPIVNVPLFADPEAEGYDESKIPLGDVALPEVDEDDTEEYDGVIEDEDELEEDEETEVESEPAVEEQAPTAGATLKVKPNGQRYWSYRDSKGRWARLEIGTN